MSLLRDLKYQIKLNLASAAIRIGSLIVFAIAVLESHQHASDALAASMGAFNGSQTRTAIFSSESEVILFSSAAGIGLIIALAIGALIGGSEMRSQGLALRVCLSPNRLSLIKSWMISAAIFGAAIILISILGSIIGFGVADWESVPGNILSYHFGTQAITAVAGGAIAGVLGVGMSVALRSDFLAIGAAFVWITGIEFILSGNAQLIPQRWLPWASIQATVLTAGSDLSLIDFVVALAWVSAIGAIGIRSFLTRDVRV